MEFRRLVPADAETYRTLRLRGLAEHPDAFTSSHDEETRRPLADTLARLQPDGAEIVWGAFAERALVGVVGLGRERRAKGRHKAVVFGMYVVPEHAGTGVGAALLAHVGKSTAYLGQRSHWQTGGTYNPTWRIVNNIPRHELLAEIEVQ